MQRTKNIQAKWFKRVWTIYNKYFTMNGLKYRIAIFRNGGDAYKVYFKYMNGEYYPIHRTPNWEIND